jgi:cyanophycinase-like exopeptidase
MPGSIALVGSGEYLPAMVELEKSLIEDAIAQGKKATFVQIPTAAGQESEDRLEYWRSIGKAQADRLGVEQVFLPIYDRESAMDSQYVDLITDSALIYLSGGDPHYLAQTFRDTPVWDAIVRNWRSGTSLAGCSAGAMVLSLTIPNFRILKHGPTDGLALFPEIRVIPHYNKFFKWIPDSAAKALLHPHNNEILLGIDELTALVKRTNQELWKVQGEAKVHVLSGLPVQTLSHGEEIELPVN